MIVAFVSGTCCSGRSTIAANLATLLNERFQVTFLDCDIEQIDATALLPPSWNEEKEITTLVPYLDRNKCAHCFNCVEKCRFGVFLDTKNSITVLAERCSQCGSCFNFCSGHAIQLKPLVLGTIKEARIKNLRVVESRINNFAVKADSLLHKTRSYIDPLGINIVDAAPRVSDYAYQSTLNPDFFVLVTGESLHDMKELPPTIDVLKKLCKPFGVLINKSKDESTSSSIESYCSNYNIPILGIFPFEEALFKKKIPRHKLVHHSDAWRTRFEELWEKIVKEVCQ